MRKTNGRLGRILAGSAICAFAGVAACGGQVDDPLGTTAQAVTSIVISGTVTDSSGNPVGGSSIRLDGSAQKVAFADFVTGHYSFTVAPGSYSLTAADECLVFSPDVVNLNNLTANTTVNFLGSGNDLFTNCEPASSSGGTSGTFTLSGHVTSAGHPVPGAKVTLNGSAQGFRYADETGAYSFLVNRGSYSLSTSLGCNSYSPNPANLNNLAASRAQDFNGGGNCPPAPLSFCPMFDADFDLASLGDVCSPIITDNNCADRLFTWDSTILDDLGFINGTDCRFGKFAPPLFNALSSAQTVNQIVNFILYFFGCPFVGDQIGPLNDGLVPAFLLQQGTHFTTADLQALSDDFVAAVQQSLSDFGFPALTTAQLNAVRAQLAYLQTTVPGTVSSSSFTFSTCGDAGH